MQYQKITKLLDNTPNKVPRFITTKRIEVHDQSGKSYNTNKQIRFKTPNAMLELKKEIEVK